MDVTKMKKSLMVQFPCARGRAFVNKNIGDYVQAIASRQYCGENCEYIEQEEANTYYPQDKQKTRMIMNGWFQWRAENWPPSEYIYPLLISMHISPLKAKELLTEEGITFLKKYAPVGCRDLGTKALLDDVGVPTYFSSCLTLTVGKKYAIKGEEERKGIYIVDPYFELPDLYEEKDGKKKWSKKLILSSLGYLVTHFFPIYKLAKKDFFSVYQPTGFVDTNRAWYRPWHKAIQFYRVYRKKFSRELLLKAEYVNHWVLVDMKKDTNDDLLNMAEDLVKKYAAAELLITSRIHAGLPALGLNTPVIFVTNEAITAENSTFNTPGRLGGLLELFRVMVFHNGEFVAEDEVLQRFDVITTDTKFENKKDWEPYAKELEVKCMEFMEG